ncbi:thiamine biosynthesis lipoprotein [Succinivibrio dextrinosolvens]|uniref:FAD:protein FMN transferase n=1 Tax=Succinivibrio dextrinosolvens TaxID=83771 RepID=UPI0008E2D55D|nr:FAD:protein FMN transferase [Succinivibrio dextrinosolvens]SFS87277.1 thiamine biosynthesis lipoprotein [Succinivibrio dextrinosolvens]
MKRNHLIVSTAVFLLLCSSLSGCNDRSEANVSEQRTAVSTKIQGKTMGTFYAVNVVGGYKGGESALTELAENCFKKICDEISTFDKNAELAKFNDFKSTEPYEISSDLSKIIQDTVYQGRRIDEATDITVGPLVNLWGFGINKRNDSAPTEEQIAEAKKLVGFDKFEIRFEGEKSYLIKKDPDVRLDLSTVGEGLGADAVAEELIKQGYKDFMVNVAGASRSYGVNAEGRKWKLGIEDPTSPTPKLFVPICALDKAVTTAGSYRNFFKDEKSGTVYSHAIDPKTGYPVSHKTLSVTVISDSAFEADALDTGLLVLGADKTLEWGEKNNYPLATIEYKDGKPVLRHTKQFEPYLKCGSENKEK